MNTQRNGGMTTIGVLNIVLGAIGSLMALLVVVGGGFLAAAGAADSSGSELGSAAAAGGGMLMILGLVGLLCWAMLAFSGIGVLKLAPWGRTLSMICGGVLVALNLFSMVNGGFSILSVAFMLYGGLLVGLFMQPQWKAAFCGQGQGGAHGQTYGSDEMRRAA
jgi:hypothetical protein